MAEAGCEVRVEYAKIDGEVTGELALYLGPYLPTLGARLDTAINPFVGVLLSMLETLPLMMLGMALFRNGFLPGGCEAADYRRPVRAGLLPGVLLALLFLCLHGG